MRVGLSRRSSMHPSDILAASHVARSSDASHVQLAAQQPSQYLPAGKELLKVRVVMLGEGSDKNESTDELAQALSQKFLPGHLLSAPQFPLWSSCTRLSMIACTRLKPHALTNFVQALSLSHTEFKVVTTVQIQCSCQKPHLTTVWSPYFQNTDIEKWGPASPAGLSSWGSRWYWPLYRKDICSHCKDLCLWDVVKRRYLQIIVYTSFTGSAPQKKMEMTNACMQNETRGTTTAHHRTADGERQRGRWNEKRGRSVEREIKEE